MDALLNGGRVATAVDDDGVVLIDLHLAGTAEVGQLHVGEVHVQLGGNIGAAGQDGDVAEHLLAAVAEAGRLDADAVEAAAQTVDQQGRQGVALDVLGDDDELLAALDDLLQDGQDVLNGGDLLVGDEDIRVVDDGLHLVGVGDHIGGDVAAVELHTLDDVQAGLGGLGFLDGDDAGSADLLHGLGDQLADLLVAAGDRTDARDVRAAVDGLRIFLNGLDGGVDCLLHTLAHDHRVCAGGDVLQALADDGLRQQGRGGRAVAGDVVGLSRDLADELRAHVLKRILQLHVLGDRDAVVRDERSTVLLAEHDVAALRAERDLHGVCKLVNAALQFLAGVFAEFNHFCHSNLPPELFYNRENVALANDGIIDAVELDLGAGVFRHDHAVADTNFHLHFIAVHHAAGANRDDLGEHGLFLVRSGKNDAGSGGLHRLNGLEQNTVCKGLQFHIVPPKHVRWFPIVVYRFILALNRSEC